MISITKRVNILRGSVVRFIFLVIGLFVSFTVNADGFRYTFSITEGQESPVCIAYKKNLEAQSYRYYPHCGREIVDGFGLESLGEGRVLSDAEVRKYGGYYREYLLYGTIEYPSKVDSFLADERNYMRFYDRTMDINNDGVKDRIVLIKDGECKDYRGFYWLKPLIVNKDLSVNVDQSKAFYQCNAGDCLERRLDIFGNDQQTFTLFRFRGEGYIDRRTSPIDLSLTKKQRESALLELKMYKIMGEDMQRVCTFSRSKIHVNR